MNIFIVKKIIRPEKKKIGIEHSCFYIFRQSTDGIWTMFWRTTWATSGPRPAPPWCARWGCTSWSVSGGGWRTRWWQLSRQQKSSPALWCLQCLQPQSSLPGHRCRSPGYSHPLHLCGAGDQQGTTPGRPVHGHLLPPYHLEVKHGSWAVQSQRKSSIILLFIGFSFSGPLLVRSAQR